MKLGTYIANEIESGRATSKKDAYARLAAKIAESPGPERVSAMTIEHVAGGMMLKRYDKAKAISLATDGLVSIPELCS